MRRAGQTLYRGLNRAQRAAARAGSLLLPYRGGGGAGAGGAGGSGG